MDRYLIDLLLQQVHRGNEIDYTFDNQPWIDMAVMFKERFGLQYDIDILKSHYKSLGKLFNDVKNILGQRGFFWDETCHLLTAYDDFWDDYIKVLCLFFILCMPFPVRSG